MIKKIPLEIIVCFVLVLIGLGAYLTVGFAEDTASKFLLRQERNMGSLDYKSLPQIYALALITLCTANIFLMTLKQRRSEQARDESITPEDGADAQKTRIGTRTVATAALLIAYAAIMPLVPFFVSTSVFLFLLFILYGKTNLKIVLPLTLGGTAFFWFVFIKIASLPIGTM